MKRLSLFLGWLVVVGLATTLTWQIVSAADDRVSERPIAPLNVAAPALADAATTSTSIPGASTTTSSAATAPTTAPGTTATTSPATSGSTTTSTAASAVAASDWQARSVQTAGGTVNLRYRPGEVAYQSASPAPGFHVEVETPGPPSVKVEFESESQKVEVEASWEDDGLEVRVSTDQEDE